MPFVAIDWRIQFHIIQLKLLMMFPPLEFHLQALTNFALVPIRPYNDPVKVSLRNFLFPIL